MFEIRIDRFRCIVRLRFAGLLTTAQVHDYVAEMQRRFADEIGERPYVLLIDAVASKLQTQETMGVLMAHIGGSRGARRIAIVTGASPTTMQLRRALDATRTRFFDDAAAAEAWLLDRGSVASRAA